MKWDRHVIDVAAVSARLEPIAPLSGGHRDCCGGTTNRRKSWSATGDGIEKDEYARALGDGDIEDAMREAARLFAELGVDPVWYLAALLQEVCLTGRDDYGEEVSLAPSICADPLRFAIAVADATQEDGSNEPFGGRLPLELSWCE